MSNSPRPAMIALKCPVCSAPMRMRTDFEAECEHCGTTTVLPSVREGADIRRIAEASAGTSAAADRIAAELALPRLTAERESLLASRATFVAEASGKSASGVGAIALSGLAAAFVVGTVVGSFASTASGVVAGVVVAVSGLALAYRAADVGGPDTRRLDERIGRVEAEIANARRVLGRG